MPRFKLTLEYAGTRYSGWQIQKNARTVAGEIDRAVRTVTKRADFELYGSGRTDAGVHAAAQVAHLDVVTTLPPELLRRRVNDELPADINLLRVEPVGSDQALNAPRVHPVVDNGHVGARADEQPSGSENGRNRAERQQTPAPIEHGAHAGPGHLWRCGV